MRKLKLYIAVSLNGKIARDDGSVDWLEEVPNPDKLDFGYKDFYDSVDTTIQGHATYDQIMGWGIPFPYTGKKNFVVTRNPERQDTEHVKFISGDPVDFVRGLKSQGGSSDGLAGGESPGSKSSGSSDDSQQGAGKDIWLIGGGQVNTLFLNAGLIDEMILLVMPVILSDGIDLFSGVPEDSSLELLVSRSWPNGVVELRYGRSVR